MKTVVKYCKEAASKVSIYTTGTNILLTGSIALIWGLVNALQMVMNLRISEEGFPPNVDYLYNVMLPLANLDVIPPEFSTEVLFEFSDDVDKPYNKRLEEMGYDNHNAIENIGSMVYFIALTIFLLIVSLILSIIIFKCGCCKTKKMSNIA